MNTAHGASFRKVDLHVHTPESVCYNDDSVTPEQIVEAALAIGLEAIGVTDHNTVAAIDGIRQVAGKRDLFVFPGVELTTKGGHILAIFEPDAPVERLEAFLDHIGISREGWGDAATMVGIGMEETFRKIDEWGGMAIAAHIERWPSGFLETNEPRKIKVRTHSNQYLSALEITIPQNKSSWNAGQMRGYPKKYACVQGSDAHALDDIGRRPVYIQMEEVGLDGLRLAFREYEARIVFNNEVGPSK